jgi:antitoxin (DNA-binding transcriptional repressor) of toxin-antitoxin stability system
MKNVRIGDLKARLSEHLRFVRRGHSLTVLDRDTPVAQIVPQGSEGSSLVVRKPAPGLPAPSRIPLPPPMKAGRDILALLLEDRSGGR